MNLKPGEAVRNMAESDGAGIPEFMNLVLDDEQPASVRAVAERAVLALNESMMIFSCDYFLMDVELLGGGGRAGHRTRDGKTRQGGDSADPCAVPFQRLALEDEPHQGNWPGANGRRTPGSLIPKRPDAYINWSTAHGFRATHHRHDS